MAEPETEQGVSGQEPSSSEGEGPKLPTIEDRRMVDFANHVWTVDQMIEGLKGMGAEDPEEVVHAVNALANIVEDVGERFGKPMTEDDRRQFRRDLVRWVVESRSKSPLAGEIPAVPTFTPDQTEQFLALVEQRGLISAGTLPQPAPAGGK